ncbi:hypothetical protein BK634_22080 [Pseudomonas chlororaphis]|nr:hypothetical protein BK634_22080 [Pseudomonas chlororaphis]
MHVTNINVWQVTSSQVQVLINSIRHDQDISQTHAIQLVQQIFGFRCFNSEVLNHDQTISTHQLSKDGTHCCAIHLLVQLLGVILWTSCESGTAAAPDWATNSTGTSTASTFLTPWALTATTNVGTGLLLLATLTAASHVGHDCLVNQRLVELAAKCQFGNFDRLSVIYI